MAEKKINFKKIYTELNKCCKSLRKDGLYFPIVDSNKVISANIDNTDTVTSCVSEIIFDDEYEHYLELLGDTVNGVELNKALTGTKCEVKLFEDKIIVSSTKGDWNTGIDLVSQDNMKDIFKQHSKYIRLFNSVDIFSSYEIDITELDKTFCINYGPELDTILLPVTNKMTMGRDKETISIKLYLTDYIEREEDSDEGLRMLKIEIKQPHCTLNHYYVFID